MDDAGQVYAYQGGEIFTACIKYMFVLLHLKLLVDSQKGNLFISFSNFIILSLEYNIVCDWLSFMNTFFGHCPLSVSMCAQRMIPKENNRCNSVMVYGYAYIIEHLLIHHVHA
jgi:hypothetical protein